MCADVAVSHVLGHCPQGLCRPASAPTVCHLFKDHDDRATFLAHVSFVGSAIEHALTELEQHTADPGEAEDDNDRIHAWLFDVSEVGSESPP